MNIQATSGVSLPPQGSTVARSAVREVKSADETTLKPAGETTLRAASDSSATATQPVDQKALEAAVKSVRDFVEPINNNLQFSVNHDTGQMVVKIVDSATKQVIRQIPSEEMISLAKALDSIKGLFVKQLA